MNQTFVTLSESTEPRSPGRRWVQGLRSIRSSAPVAFRLFGLASCLAAVLLGLAATWHVHRSAGIPLSYSWLSASAHDTHWARPWAGYLGTVLLLGAFLDRWCQLALVLLWLGMASAAVADHHPAALVLLFVAWCAGVGLRRRFARRRSEIPELQVRWPKSAANRSSGSGREASAAPAAARPIAANAQPALRFAARKASTDFSSIDGAQALKTEMLAAAREGLRRAPGARNGILLHGAPGNGKTVFADALAGELRVPILTVSVADLVSRWVGEAPQGLAEVFRCAQAQAPCILFFDECESLLARRDDDRSIRDEVNLTNVFLTGAVDLRGRGVLLMAATNFVDRIDPAALREGRFDFKLRVDPPDEIARFGILAAAVCGRRVVQTALLSDQHGDPPHAASADEQGRQLLRFIARRWEGFSAARLDAIGKRAAALRLEMRNRRARALQYRDLVHCLRQVQGRSDLQPAGLSPLDCLSIDSRARSALGELSRVMSDPSDFEGAGGKLPRTLLLRGPARSGKTTAAHALARAAGWALFTLPVAQLKRDPAAFRAVMERACDERPALVLIDGVPSLDKSAAAQISQAPATATTDIRAIGEALSGMAAMPPDVLLVLAAGDAMGRDELVAQGCMFDAVVELAPLGARDAASFALGWLAERGWTVACDPQDLGAILQGRTVGELAERMQQAVNAVLVRAAAEGRRSPRRVLDSSVLRWPDFSAGLRG